MIKIENQLFHLQTKESSYIFCVDKHGKLIHLYYGQRLENDNEEALGQHQIIGVGSSVLYDKTDTTSSMTMKLLELSEPQIGDYRVLSTDIWSDKQQATDFKYVGYELDKVFQSDLPRGHDVSERLSIYVEDSLTGVRLELVYEVFYDSNVLSRYLVVTNTGIDDLVISNLGVNVDLMNDNFELLSYHGGWIREAHEYVNDLGMGRSVIASTTTSSSNQHQPGFFLRSKDSSDVYGFNLIYSGNHMSVIERTPHEMVRVVSGVNPETFQWTLKSNERYETPSLIMSYSKGINKVSQNFHHFINQHLVPKPWANKERPITYNHWEATFFDYNEKKLLKYARSAKELGCELFVLDDGWFTERNNDLSGLSNYQVDPKKFPHGMKHFSNKIHELGMLFGIWVEPEMVSEKSELYRQHPEYALGVRDKRYGRNQLVLDLTIPAVRDYIVLNVKELIEEYSVDYIKWDMNRHIGDTESLAINHGKEFSHRYILGLYDILERIFVGSDVLLESCSSGGNRFDLGMLAYGAQVWSSDDTDPIERLSIQGGLSRLYPLSTISAHVASELSQQTLRRTPLSTRFNVASFGVLGYELDLTYLTSVEKKEVKAQTDWYKRYRKAFQFGLFTQHNNVWQVTLDGITIVGIFQKLTSASPPSDRLRVVGLDPKKLYHVSSKPQRIFIDRYKELIKHVIPLDINPSGKLMELTNQYFSLQDQQQELIASGALLEAGIWLNSQYLGTGYDKQLRLWGDFGSTLYVITEKENTL